MQTNALANHRRRPLDDPWNQQTPVTGRLSPTILFGRYVLVRQLAAGGMAELHLARPLHDDNSLVVIKRVLPEFADDAKMVRMFLDEASIAASLRHPNVAKTLDVDRADRKFYFVMEFLRGANVFDLLKRLGTSKRPLPLNHALAMIIGACRGLHYAHEKRSEDDGSPLEIVHRDISPQNIFITYDGVPKIVDFGIAKATTRFTKTRPGALKGKLHYMSAEQCRSVDLDRRTDIFSLAIILWELTTGSRLYRGGCELEVMKAIVEQDARPPSSVHPRYPAALERIVMRGLEREPEDRYQTAAQMQHDLEEFASTVGLDVGESALSRFMNDVFADQSGIDEMASEASEPDLCGYGQEKDNLQCVVISPAAPSGKPAAAGADEVTDEVSAAFFKPRGRAGLRSLGPVVLYLSVLAALCALLVGAN